MAELTQTEIEDKIATLDTSIATLTDSLASGGTAAATLTDYSMGQVSVNGSQRLQQLMDARKYYQELLQKMPKETTNVHGYHVDVDGQDNSDYLGDE